MPMWLAFYRWTRGRRPAAVESAACPIAGADWRWPVVRVRVRRPITAGRLQAALQRRCWQSQGHRRWRRRRRLGAVRGRVHRVVREDGRSASQTVGRRERCDGRTGGPVQRARGAPEIVGPTTNRGSGHRRSQQIQSRRTPAQRQRRRLRSREGSLFLHVVHISVHLRVHFLDDHNLYRRRYYYHHRNYYLRRLLLLFVDIRRRTNTLGPLRPQTQTAVGRGRVHSELTSSAA